MYDAFASPKKIVWTVNGQVTSEIIFDIGDLEAILSGISNDLEDEFAGREFQFEVDSFDEEVSREVNIFVSYTTFLVEDNEDEYAIINKRVSEKLEESGIDIYDFRLEGVI